VLKKFLKEAFWMKWAKFVHKGKEYTGYVEEENLLVVEGNMFSSWKATGESIPLHDVTLLAPCRPTTVAAIGLNYRDHAKEMKMELPKEPILFLKAASSVIGHGAPIVYPQWIGRMDYEAELVLVIGRKAKNVSVQDAQDYIFGYTCGNDVTARHLQKTDGQWARAKSFDTFCPLGPWIVTGVDASNLAISADLNGETRQQSSTAQLVFGPAELVSFVSRVMTLEPGDVIMTGTPSGVGPLKADDQVTVRIEQIGELSNPVVIKDH
jgi:2-keto-4-pentenoate hydratase/2-oxohepta-3-ene-1,7-dioic acid hydratase in catechol pathway